MLETLELKSEKYLFPPQEMEPLIKSFSFSQDSILQSIIQLHIPSGKIHCDPCYNKGGFYKSGKISAPELRSDINPIHKVPVFDCRKLPCEDNSIKSIIFDPPFVTYAGKNGYHCMRKYGSFQTLKALLDMYRDSFQEFYRILKKKGILIVKCQDGTYGPDLYLTHINAVVLPCEKIGFKAIDFFILLSKGRPERRDCTQRHARKYHSYFIVFKK